MRRQAPVDRLRDLPAGRGLTAAEVRARRASYGPNDIVEVAPHPWWDLIRDTARDPMIWFLVGTGGLYGLLGDTIEAATLFAATLPLIAMDAVLHRRARASTEGLQSHLVAWARVERDGRAMEIPAFEIVPGDLVLVSAGDPFPADGLIVSGEELKTDESMLTGEAYPVRKRSLTEVPSDAPEPAIEGEHWGFAGTRLLTGRAGLRVVFTGGETLYGEIVRSATRGTQERTPLQMAIAGLVSVLVAAAAVVCVILAMVRLRQGYGWVDALLSASTLAVAALPEEFPVVFTFFLGVGVYRLAKQRALVRRAVSVENIGRTTWICSDKTGTITEGRLRLTHLLPADGISGERLLFLASIASLRSAGDPLDAAILREAGAAPPGTDVLATFPFTEARKRETAVIRDRDGALLASTKGAAELLLGMSSLSETERDAWEGRITKLATDGHKVIACAWRPLDTAIWVGGEPDRDLRLGGLLAFEDPVRAGVAEAVQACREAGIHTIMVTGDHPATARAVAREIGLGEPAPAIISGDELEERLEHRGAHGLDTVDVIARAVPAQKLRLVQALEAAGHVVAVTGDGVNDVPALQAADIGIAMGERGTRSAREVAAIVLLDDNFRTIVRAIGEGRQLFRNLERSFAYLLMIHIPLVTTAALIPLAGYPLLYLPIHIVWLEIIIHPTAMLAFQDPWKGSLAVGARPPAGFFSRRDWLLIGTTGLLLASLVGAGYVRSLGSDDNVAHARAMALATLTFGSVAITAALSRLRTRMSRLVAAGTMALSTVLIEAPAAAALLHLEPLHADDLGIAVAGAAVVALLVLAGR